VAVVNRLDYGCPFMSGHELVPSEISGYMLRLAVFLGIWFRETFVQERVGVWYRQSVCQVAQRLIGVFWLYRPGLYLCLSPYIVMTIIGCD
jgi:hypothetical protein